MNRSSGSIRRHRSAVLATVAAGALLAACGVPTSFGDPDSLIVVAPDSLWSEVEDSTYAALEPTVFTTREEKKFVVTHAAPGSEELPQLLLWRNVLVFGTPGDDRVGRILDAAGRDSAEPGEIVEAGDVWARGQTATAIVLEPGREVETWLAALPELVRRIDERFREYATTRMYVSGVDTALATTLRDSLGFELRVPQVYEHGLRGDVVVLRNDNPRPADLIRSVLVQRLPPRDTLTADAVYEWRAAVDSVHYPVPHDIRRAPIEPRRLEVDGRPAIEVRGIWSDEAEYPAAGPFIARAVACPEATFFIDAWLYSPSPRRSKYEYMIQLEEILGSFRCAGG